MRNYRHFAIGMNANGSKIKRIVKPTDTEPPLIVVIRRRRGGGARGISATS